MFSSYKEEDVIILLKDISNMVTPQSTEEREKLIQSGHHYSEMLPIEYVPTNDYIKIYERSLKLHSKITASAAKEVAKKIIKDKKNPVLVSLARAGTPIGILIKHYIEKKYGIKVFHYTISIIRGKGIDKNAINYILARHDAGSIQFIDGWIGKGAIQNELNKAMEEYVDVDPRLAVLSDPAYITEFFGTHEDFLIANSCLNSTVSGLLSRTFYRDDIIGPDDFHGAMFYDNLINEDRTYEFINEIENNFDFSDNESNDIDNGFNNEVLKIKEEFNIKDINLIKPSIGEATRVLLRRIPWKILVYSLDDEINLGHIYQLANEKNVEICLYPLKNYKACGLIKKLGNN